ncbi:hypothetical protein [Erythrobacter sp.]|uniref:hypothetical protein n=1 Tax=Erythrobacter sp. TaxID=1042 RepID=UPI001425F4B5|nr:hypothetical protein [Erythrobacter sp.]QIQ86039.1 MAG: hypothetical protein G9473_04570 [Erythrobacter sp.]
MRFSALAKRVERFVDRQVRPPRTFYQWRWLLSIPLIPVIALLVYLVNNGHIVAACLGTGPGFAIVFGWVRFLLRRQEAMSQRPEDRPF